MDLTTMLGWLLIANLLLFIFYGLLDMLGISSRPPKAESTYRLFRFLCLNVVMALAYTLTPLPLWKVMIAMVLGVSLNSLGVAEATMMARINKEENEKAK